MTRTGIEEAGPCAARVKKCPVDTFLGRGNRARAPPGAEAARAQIVPWSAAEEGARADEAAGHHKRDATTTDSYGSLPIAPEPA